MTLALDLGNTRIKAAIFSAQNLAHSFEISGFEELVLQLNEKNLFPHLRHVLITSVRQQEVSSILPQELLTIPVFELQPNFGKLPYQSNYETNETLGLDRVCNIAAAISRFQDEACLVVDLGTCVTYELVHHKTFLGGRISPGLDMRLQAMSAFTEKLPMAKIESQHLPQSVAVSTIENLKAGAFHGMVHEISAFINELEEQFTSLNIVFTGGDATLFAEKIKKVTFADSFFTLRGLNYIFLSH